MPKRKPIYELPPSPLCKVPSGYKNMLVRLNRDLILEFNGTFGADWTKAFFNLSQKTLDALSKREAKQYQKPVRPRHDDTEKQLEAVRIRIDILHAELAEVKKEMRELKGEYSRFVESVSGQVTKALIIPLIRNVLKFEGELPERIDELNIDRLIESAHGRR